MASKRNPESPCSICGTYGVSADGDLVREALLNLPNALEGEAAVWNEEGLAALARLEARIAEVEGERECVGGHDTSEMLWPGTAHQGVVCCRCNRFLPC